MTRPTVDIYVGDEGLETVRCSPSRLAGQTGANLELEAVQFRNVSDDTLQQIADAIELYLIRKNQKQRRERAKTPAPAVAAAPEGTPDAKT